MKRPLLNFFFGAISFAAVTLAANAADDAQLLAGKWSVRTVNDRGLTNTQTIEIKGDKFVFQSLADDKVTVYAEGELKLEKLGPFKAARFFHIRGGESASDLEAVDDEYVSIYKLEEDSWTVAGNFDKEREQKPTVDVYRRVRTAEAGTLVIDEIEMSETPQNATWFLCFEATADGVSRRHHVENKGYSKSKVTIPMALELPKARAGQKCSFTLKLDDVDADVCTDEVDNRSTGELTISERGSQFYKPEANWHYTIRWHLKR
jgi:hypothetical protein